MYTTRPGFLLQKRTMRASNGYETARTTSTTAKAWKDKKRLRERSRTQRTHKSERASEERTVLANAFYPHVSKDADGKENEGRRYQSENKMTQFDLQQLHSMAS